MTEAPRRPDRRRFLAASAAVSIAAPILGPGALTAGAAAPRRAGWAVPGRDADGGRTLPLFGFNTAHFVPGSNTTAWFDYSRSNASRTFASPNHWITAGMIGPGEECQDLAAFEALRSELLAAPEDNRFLDWPAIKVRYAEVITGGSNQLNADELFGALDDLGIEMVAQTDASGTWPDDWPEMWRKWQYNFAHAYYLAKNFGVRRFALVNEPDAKGVRDKIPDQGHLLRALRFGSDAVHRATELAAAATGDHRPGLVHAPVITRSTMPDDAREFQPYNLEANPMVTGYYGNDTRDDEIGWGKLALLNLHTDYRGETTDEAMFEVFDTHSYNQPPSWYRREIETIFAKLDEYAPDADLPVAYTEINRYNTSGFAGISESLETPRVARENVETAATLTAGGVQALIFFKMENTLGSDGKPYKSGFFYVEHEAPFRVRGATRGAEALRLFARAFRPDVARLGPEFGDPAAGIRAWLADDRAARCFRLLSTRAAEPAAAVTPLDLARLGVRPGATITTEEVSAGYAGGVARTLTLGANRRLPLDQPADTVWLTTIPYASVKESRPLAPEQAALVRSGAEADTALGTGQGLAVRRTDGTAPNEVSLLEFAIPRFGRPGLCRATLEFAAGGSPLTVLVVAVEGLDWDERKVTWNNAPYLGGADAVLTGDGNEVRPAGQLTIGPDAGAPSAIDVTDVVRRAAGRRLTLIIIDQPTSADPTPDDGRAATLMTPEGTPPRIRLWT